MVSEITIHHSDDVIRPLLPMLDAAYETLLSHGCNIQAEAVRGAISIIRTEEI